MILIQVVILCRKGRINESTYNKGVCVCFFFETRVYFKSNRYRLSTCNKLKFYNKNEICSCWRWSAEYWTINGVTCDLASVVEMFNRWCRYIYEFWRYFIRGCFDQWSDKYELFYPFNIFKYRWKLYIG